VSRTPAPRPFVADRAHYEGLDATTPSGLRALAALNRINALACVTSARHGWIGASYSVAEILTVAIFGLGRQGPILSKGHAAAMQYACLYGRGLIARNRLLSYKDGPAGLPAHTETGTPGVLVNTGSLGQALAKGAGLAAADPRRRLEVVLGDGELQEGQCFEAFQTVVARRLTNLTVVVDANGWQTARPVAEIKPLDVARVLAAFGFDVREVDGHDPAALLAALGADARRPVAIVARTLKAGGSAALARAGTPARWHGGVPDAALCDEIVAEQVALAGVAALSEEWAAQRRRGRSRPAPASTVAADAKHGSTGEHFGRALARIAAVRPEVVVLDADLAAPCRLEGLDAALGPDRFFEMGIAEQDMVSFAGGLALAGRRPVVNTYASFFKRAIEQIQVNLAERGGRPVVYVGHYAGLSYHTDGRTHQSLNDLGLLRCLPGLVVADPVDGAEVDAVLAWALQQTERSVYLRLRRAGAGLDAEPRLAAARARVGWPTGAPPSPAAPPCLAGPLPLTAAPTPGVLLTVGPHATRLALDAIDALDPAAAAGFGVVVQSVFGPTTDLELWRDAFAGAEAIVTIEDGNRAGGLYGFACEAVQRLGLGCVRVAGLSVEGQGPSFRTYAECARHHGFTVEHLHDLMLARSRRD
jgi:transketolase